MNFPGSSSSPSAPPLPPPSYDDSFVPNSPTAPPPYSPGFTFPELTLPPMRSSQNTATVESQPIPKSGRRCNYKLLLAILSGLLIVAVIIIVLIFGHFGPDNFGLDDDFPTLPPFQPFPPATTTSWPNGERYNPYGK